MNDSFHVAAQRVLTRFHRMYPGRSLYLVDIKYRWYLRGNPWVPRIRFGKLKETQ